MGGVRKTGDNEEVEGLLPRGLSRRSRLWLWITVIRRHTSPPDRMLSLRSAEMIRKTKKRRSSTQFGWSCPWVSRTSMPFQMKVFYSLLSIIGTLSSEKQLLNYLLLMISVSKQPKGCPLTVWAPPTGGSSATTLWLSGRRVVQGTPLHHTSRRECWLCGLSIFATLIVVPELREGTRAQEGGVSR